MDDDENYYKQLHETSRTYEIGLWAVPGVFFGLQGLIFQALDFDNLWSLQSMVILFGDAIFSFLLWLKFEKDHVFQLLLQGRIKEFDNRLANRTSQNNIRRIPLYSMNSVELKNEMAHWEQQEPTNRLPCRSRFAAYCRVSTWFSYAMLLVVLLSVAVAIFILAHQ